MKSVALIPARGGSKRLPRKNILPFLGKPIIAYTIEAALETGLFDRVCVSSEDEEIQEIARKYGAEISIRSEDLATDKAMVRNVTGDFLRQEEEIGRKYDAICVLYATAPMRRAEDIKGVHALLEFGICHHSTAIVDFSNAPHQALKVVSEKGDLEPMWPDIVAARADTLPYLVSNNGSTYSVMVEDFKKNLNFYAPKMRGYFMPRWKSIDIDTQDDFDFALYLAKKHKVFESSGVV